MSASDMRGDATRMSLRSCGVRSSRRLAFAAILFLTGVTDMSSSDQFRELPDRRCAGSWTATQTGSGDPRWTVESDDTAPSKAKVIRQSGRATFPLLLNDDAPIADGFVEVKFKAVAGSEDRAAGVVWR